ncbi:MAG: pyridoxal phosphate-dependent aminotransferase [Calditrichales bacterium]|nr:MAG: pyridoxal phosphate-dependent aminotransferase [Calditrichales bacterium]
MPRFPRFAQKVSHIKGAVFEKYRQSMQAYGDGLVRLHIGDTYLPPAYPVPIDSGFLSGQADYSRYCDTFGIPALRQALAEKVNEDNALIAGPENILVTAGATNALSSALHALLNPGDEILVFTPCWPIFPGIIQSVPARMVEVSLYTKLLENPEMDIYGYLNRFFTGKTVAIYLNSPNNPSGKVLNREQLKMIAQFARDRRLWVITDEAYDGLLFDKRTQVSIGAMDEIRLQTVSVFTFSKIFMFAGLRLGYAVAERKIIEAMNKIMVHQLYSPATVTQQMMVEPVKSRKAWMGDVRDKYQNLRDLFLSHLSLPVPPPEATYFLFFSLAPYLGGRNYDDVIKRCFAEGVSVAPGIDFGRDYERWVRLCFTGETPEKLVEGASKLKKILTE